MDHVFMLYSWKAVVHTVTWVACLFSVYFDNSTVFCALSSADAETY